MILLDSRLDLLLAREPEWLDIPQDTNGSQSFVGWYLRIGNRPFGLGRELGRGEEAIVFELIDLRAGTFHHVVKVCRHRRGTRHYRRWAVPVRFQRNPAAQIPDIELFPCHLIPLPSGGVVKIQRYISSDPSTDWRSTLPIIPVLSAIKGNPDGAEALIDSLIAKHGEQGILLELKGRMLFANDRLDEALDCLTRALARHVALGSSSRYAAAVSLAKVMEEIYQRDRSKGDFAASLQLKDDTTLRQTIFSSATEAAKDDSLQDRSLFALLEVMSDLPYFVGGLNFMQESLLDFSDGESFKKLTAAVARIDPDNPMLGRLREAGIWTSEDNERAESGGESSGQCDEVTGDRKVEAQSTEPPTRTPNEVLKSIADHEAAYDPESDKIRSGRARVAAAISDIRRGREDQAEANLKEAVSIGPDVADYRIALATFLSSSGRAEEAIGVLREAVQKLEGTPALRLLLGSTLLRSGKLDEAERTLLKARPLLPERESEIRLMLTEIVERRRLL